MVRLPMAIKTSLVLMLSSVQARRRTGTGTAVMLTFLGVLAIAGCSGEQSAAPASSTAYPVKIGPTGRYLVNQYGAPFLMIGESPQAMIGNLSEAAADLFLANRQSHGFNTVWINLLCASGTKCHADG